MDNYSWAQHYSRLRASGNQMNQLNVGPGLNVGQSGHQLNVNDHLGIGVAANATNQAISGHYGSSAAHPHSWLFSSHGLNAATHQTPNHESSSFNASPFLHHPSYESSFLSAPFQSKAGYLPTAATGFFNPMKKADNDMNNLRNAAYCTTMNMSGMSANVSNINNMATDPNASLTTGSLFPSHLTPSSWRHHTNLMATNSSSGAFGILPHEAVNVMNSGSASVGSSHSHASHTSHNSSSHHTNSSSHNKTSTESSKQHHYHHHHHKTSSGMPAMASVDNSFRNIIPSLPPTQSSHAISSRNQTSFEPNVSAKITSAHPHPHPHHHHSQSDPYGAFAMAAAAHAINSDYASMQSMQQQRYASGMTSANQHTAFASNTTPRTSYPSVGFHSDPTARSRELLSSSSLLHSSKQSSSNSCNARNMSAMNANSYLSNCGMMSMMNTSSVSNYSPSPSHSVNNVVSNNLAVNSSASRSSSSASNHALQQGNDSSCSYGYGSPATNLPQSPYQQQPQRSNTSNSSQGTPTAAGPAVQSSTQDYSNYGTPQGFPSMGTQTPTPTPGYPTPPSSVGQPHVTPSNSQASAAHEEQQQVTHYPQLTPQTPTQTTPFAGNYNSNFASNPKLTTNTNRTSESILPNTSSCMVAAAAVANMNNSQNGSSGVTQRPPSGYLIAGTNLHESDAESCLSNMVNVNPLSDSISNAKLSDPQMNSTNDVIGHQTEPTLNSVFSSQEIDFPIINFPVSDETTNAFNNVVKLEQNSFNKKKSKNSKKGKKKDKNKVGVGISVNPNNAFPAYHYPPQQQYQNSYPPIPRDHTNAYLMQQTIGHQQQPQQTHNVLHNDSTPDNQTNADSCYDMQYQQHLTQQVPQQQHQQQQQHHQQQQQQHQHQQQQQAIQQEHEMMQQMPPHESLQQTVQTQEHQMIEPVMSMQSQSQHLTQPQTTSVSEKPTFPTIDDELSFLTEPTECVSMETQTPNVQMDTQTPLVINTTSNICSERSDLSPNGNNSNSNQGNSASQASGFLKSFMTFISDGSRLSPTGPTGPTPTKEKKKKKHKESNENKVKQNNTLNGQKSNKLNKKAKMDNIFDGDNEELPDFDQRKKGNFSMINQNTNNLISGEKVAIKKTTGDRENYESKFFKRRPSVNMNTNNNTNVHVIEMDSHKDQKSSKKRKNKNDLNSFVSDTQTMHDEYEFPDSPLNTNTHSVKKQRKSSNLDNSSKKRNAPNFEKITTPSVNINFKKNNNKKSVPSALPPTIQQSSTPNPFNTTNKCESIEKSTNSVNSIATNIESQTVQSINPHNQIDEPSNPQTLNQVSQVSNPPNLKKPNASNQTNNKKQSQKSPTVKNSSTTTAISNNQTINNIETTAQITTNNSLTTTTMTTNSIMSTTNCSSTQQSVGMQSAGTNTPRRRSQDKKASTIREGLMRTGDFVVSMDESQFDLPVIWRIEGKSLLQRFEPTEQDGITVYINTSSYSAWNPTVRQRYTGVDVRIMGCSRTRIVVEKLGLTQSNPNTVNGSTPTIERVTGYNRSSTSSNSSTFHHQENFEVFIQTLISQALDPNFISEIVKENDEYFLSHVQAIDDVCSRKKSRFFSKVKWDANIVKCVETYPLFTVTPQNNVGDLRCRLCHDNWSTQILQFNGEPYQQMTLEPQTAVDIKQTKYAACDPCTDKIVLYSHLHHQKYNFFIKCKSKVENMRGGDENKESHVILEQCLQDTEWINMLFKQLEEIWLTCDKIR